MSEQPSPKIADPRLLGQLCLAVLGEPALTEKTEELEDNRVRDAFELYLSHGTAFDNYTVSHGLYKYITHAARERNYTLPVATERMKAALKNILSRKGIATESEKECLKAAQSIFHQILGRLEEDKLEIDDAFHLAKSQKEIDIAKKDKIEIGPAIEYASTMISYLDSMVYYVENPVGVPGAEKPEKRRRSPNAVTSWTPSRTSDPLNQSENNLFDMSNSCLAALGNEDAIYTLKGLRKATLHKIPDQALEAWPLLKKLTETPSGHHTIKIPRGLKTLTVDIDAITNAAIEIIQGFQREESVEPGDKKKLERARDSYNAIGVRLRSRDGSFQADEQTIEKIIDYTATVASQLDVMLQYIEKKEKQEILDKALVLLGNKEATLDMESGPNPELRTFVEQAKERRRIFSRILTAEDWVQLDFNMPGKKEPEFNFNVETSRTWKILERLRENPIRIAPVMKEQIERVRRAYNIIGRELKEGHPNLKQGSEISVAIDHAEKTACQMDAVMEYVENSIESWKKESPDGKGLW